MPTSCVRLRGGGLQGGMPSTVGRYAVGDKLGEGTFGTVMKGAHQLAGEKVAIKVLEKRRMQQADDIERVGREIQILKQLKHPHVIRLWEIIHTSDRIYLIMEFTARGELFQHIVKAGRLSEDEGRRFFNQIVAGVSYLHANNVVHRDIKPENLLLDSEKTIRIIDFGLSTKCAPGQVLKHACGSPCYAAPEMLTREGQTHGYVGHPVDIWSSGITLFAMICGFLPFEHQNTSQLYKKIIAGDYTAPPFLSREAKDVIKRLLTTDPQRRWSLEQIAAHPWCTAGGAASSVIRAGSSEAGAVAQLLSETTPDVPTLAKMEQHGYKVDEVTTELGKHSEAAATYWLMRLHALKSARRDGGPLAPAAPNQVSARGVRPEWDAAPRPQQPQPPKQPPPQQQPAVPRNGKENHPLAQSPLAPRTLKPAADTPTKGLTRSPKPLTLLTAAYAAGGAEDTRRSSPSLMGPVGPAHAAARHRQQQQQEHQQQQQRAKEPHPDPRYDALASFRERMRAEAASKPQPASAREREAVDDAAAHYHRTARPQSARRQHPSGSYAPRPPPERSAPQAPQQQQRPPSRSVSPRHVAPGGPRDPSPRDPSPRDARPEATSRRGADFRSRKYATTAGQPRMVGLIAQK